MNISRLTLVVALTSALIACGGGSSSGSATSSSRPAASSSSVSSVVSSVASSSSSAEETSSMPSSVSSSAASSAAESSLPSSSSSSSDSSSSADNASSSSSGDESLGTLSCTDANTVQGFASLDGGTTGGAGGSYVVAKTGADIVAALKTKERKPASAPLTIYINGTITPENSGVNQFDVKDMDNLSIIGVGNAGFFDGIGINIVRANNIIVRNIKMRYVRIGQKDHISIDNNSRNIWIDHNEFYNSLEVNKDYYDELVSGKGDIDKVTLSYNHFHDSWKTSLWGSGDSNNFNRRISYIGNYWERVNSRLPLFRFGEGHILNNYYSEARESGINSRMGAHIRVEANHFENSKNVLISMDSATHGFWNASDNVLKNIEWGTYPSGNCTSTKGCVWGGVPGTTQNGGDFGVYPNAAAGDVDPSTYDPRDTAGYVVLNPVYDNGNDEIKHHVIANAGVGRLTRECLGVPEDIIEGETGGGSEPDGDGSSGSGEGETGGGDAVSAEGGWTVQAMKTGGSTAAISGSVTASSETSASFNISGGKFESSKESFFFISKVVAGDFVFTANLNSWAGATRDGSDQGSVGVMLCVECENGGNNGASARIGLRDTGILHAQRLAPTASVGKSTVTLALTPSDQLYLRISRTGDSFTVFYSVDGGNSYVSARTGTFTGGLPEDVQVGLYAAQGNNDSNSFSFDDITLETLGDE